MIILKIIGFQSFKSRRAKDIFKKKLKEVCFSANFIHL